MAELGLFPDPKILVIQGVVFLAALASANHFIIQPALRLHNERRRRTSGTVDSAKNLELKSEALENSYNQEIKSRTDEAKNLRLSEVLAGQAEAESILAQANENARAKVESVQLQLAEVLEEQKRKLPSQVDAVAQTILKQLGATTLALFALFLGLASQPSMAAGGGSVDPWYGIFWPYFQYFCFIAALVFLGKKTVNGVLESRRDVLRTKLSEAKQAITIAQKRADEFQARMNNLQAEVDTLRTQYVEDGVKERNRIVQEAQSLAAHLVRDAERAAQELVTRASEELKKDLVRQAIATVESRLSGDSAKALHETLRRESLAGISELKASALH
jgi:F0F1-type ATP synthase membrane subunit b/b'